MKGIRSDLVKRFSKIFVSLQRFAEPEHAVFDANPIVLLQSIKPENTSMAEAVEVDWLELILENSYNFLLRETYKPEGMLMTLEETSLVIISSSAVNFPALALVLVEATKVVTAVTTATIRALNFFTISFHLSFASTSAAANFALSLR